MSPCHFISFFFSSSFFPFISSVTLDQSVNTPSGATEYAVLLKKNILLKMVVAIVHKGV